MIAIILIGFAAYIGAEILFTLWVRHFNNGSWVGTESSRRLIGAAFAAVVALLLYIIITMLVLPLFSRRRRK